MTLYFLLRGEWALIWSINRVLEYLISTITKLSLLERYGFEKDEFHRNYVLVTKMCSLFHKKEIIRSIIPSFQKNSNCWPTFYSKILRTAPNLCQTLKIVVWISLSIPKTAISINSDLKVHHRLPRHCCFKIKWKCF